MSAKLTLPWKRKEKKGFSFTFQSQTLHVRRRAGNILRSFPPAGLFGPLVLTCHHPTAVAPLAVGPPWVPAVPRVAQPHVSTAGSGTWVPRGEASAPGPCCNTQGWERRGRRVYGDGETGVCGDGEIPRQTDSPACCTAVKQNPERRAAALAGAIGATGKLALL